MAFTTFIVLILAYLLYSLASRSRHKPLPPGPTPLPLIGNLHQLKRPDQPWAQLKEWHKQYGPVITVRAGMRTIINLGTHQAINDILRKRANLYGSPPKSVFFGECVTQNSLPLLISDASIRNEMRRLFAALFGPKACRAYGMFQERESVQLMLELAGGASNIASLWRYVARVITPIVHGEELDREDQSEMDDLKSLMGSISGLGTPANALVELFPFLNMLPKPFNRWKQLGSAWHQEVIRVWKRRVQRGLQSKNWNCIKLINQNKPENLTGEQFLFGAAEIESGAVYGSLLLTMFAIVLAATHPDETQRVRSEIDAVVGPDRLPCLDDLERLPLVRGFFDEMRRWRGRVSFSMPFYAAQEDEYQGYRIPAGSMIVADQWSLNTDPDSYDQPAEFRPERWISDPRLPKPVTFGYGRRTCPGERLVTNSVCLVLARLLWAFDIVPPPEYQDTNGNHGIVKVLADFDIDAARFVPRDQKRLAVMNDASKGSFPETKTILDNAARAVRLQLRA